MKRLILALGPALLLCGCTSASDDHAAEGGHGHGAGTVSFTHYSLLTEVFAEHRPLVVGKARRFDAHLSWLADYRAVKSGTLTVELIHPDRTVDQGSKGVSDTPGIFRVLVTPSKTGKPHLRMTLRADGKTSVHELGPVEVYATRELAEKANPEPPPNPQRIAFTKEVQWKIPVNTAVASNSLLAETVPVLVDVRFAPDAEAVIAAPVSGIVRTGAVMPTTGNPVRAGQALATISAQLGEGQDLASLDLDVARARISVDAARRDAGRLQALHRQEAVPLRRVQEAQSTLRTAQAELAAASRRRSALTGGGGGVPVISPISGIIVSSSLMRGSPVQAGTEMMRVGNPSQLWLVARVPEAMAARVGRPTGLDILREGRSEALTVGQQLRLVQAGSYVDPRSRTMEVVFAGGGLSLKPGTRISGRLRTGAARQILAVPASAVVDEGGQSVAYVQVEGETFERRIISTAMRSGDLVGVSGDLKPGERVVTVGAAAVRAAAATPDAFGHGHAH